MQNNVTELTQKLLRSLDSNYNVIDMPAVVEIISLLEKVAITKELLETTRLGKYVNQLRRNTSNESLAKRAKELVKRWRDTVLPDSNGQLEPPPASRKRPAKEPLEAAGAKRPRANGQMSELDFSDNSNSSFKDAKVIVINSDSNSSLPERAPKKRGRKKGSKNHKNLIEEAETSFSNKLNVSRGNAKVKTTQELLADLHIRSAAAAAAGPPNLQDLNERAAKLTERVSIIDQKLNASSRHRNAQKKLSFRSSGEVLESGVVPVRNFESVSSHKSDAFDEVIIVEDGDAKEEAPVLPLPKEVPAPKSLSIEDALALLPPIDRTVLDEPDPEPPCTCQPIENKTDFSVEDDEEEVNLQHTFEFAEDSDCPARGHLEHKYRLGATQGDERVHRLHTECLASVNGNFGVGVGKTGAEPASDGLYANVVPNVNTENLLRCSGVDYENFKKYSISEAVPVPPPAESRSASDESDSSDRRTFREWHELLETASYDGEILKILPYVIID